MREIEFRIDRRSGIAAYQQIVLQTKQALRLGVLLPGDRLPTAKEVAETGAVNPNTTLKAYRELEREGLVEPRPGLGTFVRRSLARPQTATDSPLRNELSAWMDRARAAGLDREDVNALVTSVLEERYAEAAAPTAGPAPGPTTGAAGAPMAAAATRAGRPSGHRPGHAPGHDETASGSEGHR